MKVRPSEWTVGSSPLEGLLLQSPTAHHPGALLVPPRSPHGSAHPGWRPKEDRTFPGQCPILPVPEDGLGTLSGEQQMRLKA